MPKTSPLVFSLREQIVDQLRNDVLSRRLPEGERLNEAKLVERFGVSRTPIREALQQLMHEGLLEGRPNVGLKVAACPPDNVFSLILPIRSSVELFALKSFFADIIPEDFQRWEVILKKLKVACAAKDYHAIAEYDIAFHRSIVKRANIKDLEAIWMSLVARVRSHFWETQQRNYKDPLDIYKEHVYIVDVFRKKNLKAALKALEENILLSTSTHR
jgi:DNA-binding GntR family transcriptional regulator